jgi:hypothetical protein
MENNQINQINCEICKKCDDAAKNGHLNCLIYLHIQGYFWDELTCFYAAKNGHLDCLEYAHTHGCPWDEFTCSSAAMNGHLECLQYAHTHGCPWDEWTCEYAAKNGHLECLQYAVENKFPWDKKLCLKITIKNNHILIADYIKNFLDIEIKDEVDEVFNNEVLSLNCESCKVNKKCVVYQPCNHLLSCWSCAIKTEECSNCNKKITSLLKIFFP